MIMLRLKVTHSGTASDKYMNVTSNMLEVIPSPGGVSHPSDTSVPIC